MQELTSYLSKYSFDGNCFFLFMSCISFIQKAKQPKSNFFPTYSMDGTPSAHRLYFRQDLKTMITMRLLDLSYKCRLNKFNDSHRFFFLISIVLNLSCWQILFIPQTIAVPCISTID